jgi:hypothetical protein
MELIRAVELLEQNLAKHGLIEKGWRGDFDSAKRRAGLCCFQEKKIYLSRPYVQLNEEALIWKLQAMAIGARPERCKDVGTVNTEKGKYTGTCPGCGMEAQRYRRLSPASLLLGYFHRNCPRTLSQSNRIEWKDNSTNVPLT